MFLWIREYFGQQEVLINTDLIVKVVSSSYSELLTIRMSDGTDHEIQGTLNEFATMLGAMRYEASAAELPKSEAANV